MTTIDDDGSSANRLSPRTAPHKDRSCKQRKRRTVKISAGVVTLGLVIVCGAGAAMLAYQASEVRSQLEGALNLAPQLRTELSDGDYERAQRTFDQIQGQISAARSIATNPLWTAASIIPIAGPNVSAVSEVTVSADDVATHALLPLLGIYDSLDWQALSPTGGKIDTIQLQEAAPTISGAADTVRLSYERLEAIDLSNLVPQIADPVRSTTEQLKVASEGLSAASSASRLLPAMLGTEDSRSYLVLVQNNAEARATGGIPGALATLSTDDGQISMREQSSASSLGAFRPPIDVDPEQESIYSARLGTQMQNVNLTPDFPTAALTAKRMWEERHSGQPIDGVIALDPVVLGHLLEATGPVALTDPEVLNLIGHTSLPTSLTQENVVSTLLSDVYREIQDPSAQDAYFAAVAGQVFAAFTNGHGDNGLLVKALAASVEEHRLYLWSSRPEEQEIIASTAMAGAVAGPSAGGATFGAYFNDGTGAKMDYYAARTAQLIRECPTEGYNAYTVRLTITNNAPPDAATSLPGYVTGDGVYGVRPGNFRTNYVIYGPAQSFVETAEVDSKGVPVSAGKHGQRPVGTVAVELAPGESAVLEVAFSRVVQDSEPILQVTPGVTGAENTVLPVQMASNCE